MDNPCSSLNFKDYVIWCCACHLLYLLRAHSQEILSTVLLDFQPTRNLRKYWFFQTFVKRIKYFCCAIVIPLVYIFIKYLFFSRALYSVANGFVMFFIIFHQNFLGTERGYFSTFIFQDN